MLDKISGIMNLRTRPNGHLIEAVLTDKLEGDLDDDEGVVIGSIAGKVGDVSEPIMHEWFKLMEKAVTLVVSSQPNMLAVGTGPTIEAARENTTRLDQEREAADPLDEFDKIFNT